MRRIHPPADRAILAIAQERVRQMAMLQCGVRAGKLSQILGTLAAYVMKLREQQNALDLSKLREGWDFVESENTRLLRSMTVQGSLQQWSRLQRAFEWQLQQTAEHFELKRREALIDLQARLSRLVE